ncbi:MAG: hypothetical protein AAF141_06760 [Pseudomonadota bacterium]
MEANIAANWLVPLLSGMAVATLMSVATANAEGFARTDLRGLVQSNVEIGASQYSTRAERKRLTLLCTTCIEFTAVDVLIGTSRDGTEGRYRSGATTLGRMEQICRASDDTCRLQALDIGGAVGWQSTYSDGSTSILFKDGDMLTIRAIAPSPREATQRNKAVLDALGKKIIGH